MIFSKTSTQSVLDMPIEVSGQSVSKEKKALKRKAGWLHNIACLCLFAACLGASWFVYQFLLVPQTKYYTPAWHDAQWIKGTDSNAATAYFRYGIELRTVPDNAFVTIAASQVFRLYVNGTLIGSNSNDFGNYPRAYMYEISQPLMVGVNVLAIRVDNLDGTIPLLRSNLTIISNDAVSFYGTGIGWQVTTQASSVYPQHTDISQALTAWTNQAFKASSWPFALPVAQSPISPSMVVNPLLYERPVATHWITGGAGQNAYFVRQLSLPEGSAASWLRIASTGTTNVFINGNLAITLKYQPTRLRQIVFNKVTDTLSVTYKDELLLGAYDISSYLHPGINTIAVNVTLQNKHETSDNQFPLNAELALDMMSSDNQGHTTMFTSAGWRVSYLATPGWIKGSNGDSAWTTPVDVGRPVGYGFIYLSNSNLLTSEQQASQLTPLVLVLPVVLLSVTVVLSCWLLMSLVVMRRYFSSRRDALEAMSLAYLPALAFEGLLIIISAEPLIPQPFPYTSFWLMILVLLAGTGYFLLWLYARKRTSQRICTQENTQSFQSISSHMQQSKGGISAIHSRFMAWLHMHWPIIPLVLFTMPLVFYNLGYEPYWQDELASYDVALSIMHNGLPLLPSGFVYAKGELYSYILAMVMKIFGVQSDTSRMVSGVEYLLTLLLLYYVGCYFFDRRVALLATVMLALSFHELIWAQQVRMYQQAQLLTLLTFYLFYRAVRARHRVYLVYLAAGSLILTYLSHEESFITFPALLISILLISFVMRDTCHRLPSILYQKHWWFAGAIVVGVIGLQLAIVHITHPPVLGTDVSMQPQVQLTTDNIRYYFDLLFLPTAKEPANNPLISNIPRTIIMTSVLVVLGCFWARKGNGLQVKFIALFFVISLLTLTFTFTMQADRYFYPLFTFYYLIAAFALWKILRTIWAFAITLTFRQESAESISPVMITRYHFLPIRLLITSAFAMVCLSVLMKPMLPLSGYNLFISRALGLPYYHHFGDFAGPEQYLQQNMHKGDIVISIIPDSIVLYYAGQSDYSFSINHDLFLYENGGHIVDTYTGNVALLNQSDLNGVLASHNRIWLISADNYYQRDVLRRFNIPTDFHIVFAGSTSIIYLRGG